MWPWVLELASYTCQHPPGLRHMHLVSWLTTRFSLLSDLL